MVKRFAVLGLVLLLAGSAGLRWVLAEKRKEQQRTAQYQSKYGSELRKEMEQYDEWLRLPVEKRTGLPPVLDEQGRIKTKAQLQQVQQERLKADLDKLAGGQSDSAEASAKAATDAQALADFLYGDNWQQELNKYKGQQEQKELILNASIVCASIGGAIFAGCLLLCAVRLISKVLSGLGKKEPVSQLPELQVVPQSNHSAEVATKPEQDSSLSIGTQSGCGLAPRRDEPAQRMADQTKKPLKTLFDVSKQSRLNRDGTKPISSPESPNPLNNTLIELTQQVAAIREYASTQQDRVQKLQEGYDWNIIRNFCLRVIRCIDNVENRIRERAGQNGEAVHLREIRDELLFAIESSGIEQFEPEIDSDYRGQEKHIEAVKERESCADPDLVGKIARVIRPGYQYFVDDKHVKIVRPAMVMLFG